MPTAACITAWELTEGNVSAISGGGFQTPYGTFSDAIFFVGTLTEKISKSGRPLSLRVSDPTGVVTFSIVPQKTVLIRAVDALDIPCFVAITAVVRLRVYAEKSHLELRPEILIPVDRRVRDAWLCCAAAGALARITTSPSSLGRKEFVNVLVNALANVRDENPIPISGSEIPAAITDVQLLAIITKLSGKKGAPISDVVASAVALGMDEANIKAVLSRLMEEGECYTPTTEFIKIA
jgi:RPA family protein